MFNYIRSRYHDSKAEPVPEVTRALDGAFESCEGLLLDP